MNSRTRLMIILVASAFVALTCLAYWPFIAAEILTLVALLVWLLLRIFVLSVNQHSYWYAMMFVVLASLFRFWHPSVGDPTYEKRPGMNVAIRSFEHWQSLFELTYHERDSIRHLRWELVRLLLSLYASKQHTDADLRLHEALRHREIVLPDEIHAFLFPDEVPEKQHTLLQRVQDFCLIPLRWAQRRAVQRREIAECRRRIDLVLAFIEKSLEMNDGHDDGGHRKQDQY